MSEQHAQWATRTRSQFLQILTDGLESEAKGLGIEGLVEEISIRVMMILRDAGVRVNLPEIDEREPYDEDTGRPTE